MKKSLFYIIAAAALMCGDAVASSASDISVTSAAPVSSCAMSAYSEHTSAASASQYAEPQDNTGKAIKKVTKTVVFEVTMHCENCVKKITANISFEKGVKGLEISLDKKTVTVTYDPAKTDVPTLKKAIEKLGYQVVVRE